MDDFLQRYQLVRHEVELPGGRLTVASIAGVDRLVEQAQHEDQLPFWADLWPAAIGLAWYLQRQELAGATLLELGAGPGLAGVAAAAKGAHVTITDFIADALLLAEYNARANGVTGIEFKLGDWRAFPLHNRFSWVVGSDIAYEPAVHQPLYEVVTRCTAPAGRFVLADPGRAPALKLVDLFLAAGWHWRLDELMVPWEGRRVRIDLHLLTPGG